MNFQPEVIAAFGLSVTAIVGALILQHIFGYQPCALCLDQRDPYYLGIPVFIMLLALPSILGQPRLQARVAIGLKATLLLLFAYGAYKGGYHAGVEWKWWAGPTNCAVGTPPGAISAADLLETIKSTPYVSCSEASLRIFGLSLAGWNFLVSSAIVAFMVLSITYGRQRRQNK